MIGNELTDTNGHRLDVAMCIKPSLFLVIVGLWTVEIGAQIDGHEAVTLHYENRALEQVLNDLEQKFGLIFSYGKLPLERKIFFEHQGSLDRGLEAFFKSQRLLFRRSGNRVVLRAETPIGRPLRGRVLDAENLEPMLGASIEVLGLDPAVGSSTDEDGLFRFDGLKVGRYDLMVHYLGYETKQVGQVLVTTGKEQFLEIRLYPALLAIEEVLVKGRYNPAQTINEMTTNSARSFSIEEASRFAAAISDPARMALTYAGVTGNGDDLSNEIIIRGNSSRGLLWRLEGVEIPNPNHFSDLGGTAGNISMLSASTLTNSDFYTGAFPAEFGNALSGVFDLRMRSGNWEKREHKFQIGSLGIEASAEGYLKKGTRASYLINYRYSTIDLIDHLLPSLPTQVNPFQDLSFKINVPTHKLGTFSLFGLGGKNATGGDMIADTSNFQFKWQLQDFIVKQNMGVVGLVHRYVQSDKSYLRTTLSVSQYGYKDQTWELQPDRGFISEVIDATAFQHNELALNVMYHSKLGVTNSLRVGANWRRKSFDYDYVSVADADSLTSFLDHRGNTSFSDAYIQLNSQLSDQWSLQAGVNASYLRLNGSYGIDPRVGIKYIPSSTHTWALATGIYSKPDHISTYFIDRKAINGVSEFPNRDLPMMKAWHVVASYDRQMSNDRRLRLEGYYQFLFDVPVGVDSNNVFSILNTSNAFGVIFLNDRDGAAMIPEGTGMNYGLELTFEKFYSQGSYYLLTASISDSRFSTMRGQWYATRYATNYASNFLYGKEWPVGLRKKNAISANGRLVFVGGLRTSPILLEESMAANETVIDLERYNSQHLPYYFRVDLGIHYRINAKRMTHTFSLESQNLTNRQNTEGIFYDPVRMRRAVSSQNGLIPFLNYRIEF